MSIYQVVVKGLLLGSEQLRNIHHYEFPGYVPGLAARQSFVDEFDGNLKTRLQTHLSDQVDILSYGLRRVDIADQPEEERTPTAGTWSGTGSSDLLPTQVSALITWKAFTAYPRTTRTYVFPMGENASNADGLIASTVVTALQGYGGDILTITIPGQDDAVKVAVKYTAVPRIILSSNTVETVSVAESWATQRRRRRGVGA